MTNLIDIKGVSHAYQTRMGPLPVLDGAVATTGSGAAHVSIAGTGTVAYLPRVSRDARVPVAKLVRDEIELEGSEADEHELTRSAARLYGEQPKTG